MPICLLAIFSKSLIPPIIPVFERIFKSPFKGPSDIKPVTKAANPPKTNKAGPINFCINPKPDFFSGSLSSSSLGFKANCKSFSAFLPKSETITGLGFSINRLGLPSTAPVVLDIVFPRLSILSFNLPDTLDKSSKASPILSTAIDNI